MSTELLNAEGLDGKLREMARALAEMAGGEPREAALIGIRTRGVIVAQRLQKILAAEHGLNLPLGILDITLYRDDLSTLDTHPIVRHTHLDFDVTDRLVILIDDVLYTGRTVRSALDEIIDFGRPRAIRLAVIVDRGGREYPIQPDYAAMTVQTNDRDVIKVCLDEVDGEEKVILTNRPEA
ncbi:bifunctional pyr operon transcriptional regulator/uracil phosphoribosyltransferase PyrR [bacterium]|nr:bifunctional pyr operon transcriptional regulator/uracil phosphoribosyltransferase PyrR [bacterium]